MRNYVSTGQAAGSLKIQVYNNFRGVDFTDDNVSESRSPDALNMWKNYKTLGKMIETRPDIELQLQLDNTVYGLFFYTYNLVEHWIIHVGTKLIDYDTHSQLTTVIKASGMNPRKSVGFIFNNVLFIKDGINYLEFNGTTISDVVGTIPTTTIGNKPEGGGTVYQDVNLLSSYRKNTFMGDGISTIYHLDSTNIDGVSEVKVNGTTLNPTAYVVDLANGTVTFSIAPSESNKDNVEITYSKAVSGNANKILKGTLACVFDNRIFISGNVDYPNALFWSAYNDPRYITDLNYSLEGTDMAQVKALVPSNNALWVFKEPNQSNTTVFYHNPIEIYDNRLQDTVKSYPSVHSSISIGCVATGINFNDDIVFFSDRGMEGISGDITTEQVLGHRSTLVDRKLLSETNYENLLLEEWEGYLLVVVDNKIYLADSRQIVANGTHNEYEWFYWEFAKKIKYIKENKGTLYICTELDTTGKSYIYTLTDNQTTRTVNCYWTTKRDDYGYPQMLKTTNKKGFKCDVAGSTITISSKTDNNEFETLGTYTNEKGYIVAKLKKKKWNKIQLKFSSNTFFGIYEVALESYIGSYVKR